MPSHFALPPLPLTQHQVLVDRALALPQITTILGRQLAMLAQHLLDDDIADRSIVVLAGDSIHGAAGVAAAVDLLAREAWSQVLLLPADDTLSPSMTEQLKRLTEADASPSWADEGWELPPADLVIDAIAANARTFDNTALDLVRLANSSVAPILSVGTPSGIDLGTGLLVRDHVRADATLLLAPPPLLHEDARSACGQLFLADVGLSPTAFEEVDAIYPFAENVLVRL